MKLLIILIAFYLQACASMPGDLITKESKVDNSSEVAVIPGWVPNSSFKLGVYHNSTMKPKEAILVVECKFDTIQTKEGLVINIDGNKTTLSSIDKLSDLNAGFFSKRFVTDLDFINKMVNGKSVFVRVVGNGNNTFEGEFSSDGMTTARPGFKKFVEKMK